MKNTLLAAAAILLAGIGVANAQVSGSQAGAANQTNVTAVVQGATVPGTTYANQSGHLYTTPSVPGGAYFAGTNPCLVGGGVGGAGGPIGFSLSLSKNDTGCTRRSNAAAFHSLGMDDVAVLIMTQDEDVMAAYKASGRALPGTVAPVAVAAPVAPAATATLVNSFASNAPAARKVPAWCAHAAPTATPAYVHQMCD